MAETKKTEAAAAAAPPEAACLTLRQKLVEMRKACPEIVKKQHSDGVSYKYAKIYDVWEKITPIMNELGVDFDVISEQATRHAENGDPVYWITMQTKTRNGDKLMFLYEADLTIRWLNLDNDDETIEATVHAVGWNDDPAKAKELIFSGKVIGAAEAEKIGLVNAVYAPEELIPGAIAMAKSFTANAPIAVKYSKACIDRGMQMDIDNGIALENELFAMCFATEDQKEGMGAFLEKRKEKHFQNK